MTKREQRIIEKVLNKATFGYTCCELILAGASDDLVDRYQEFWDLDGLRCTLGLRYKTEVSSEDRRNALALFLEAEEDVLG